jgi:hypothetical protein
MASSSQTLALAALVRLSLITHRADRKRPGNRRFTVRSVLGGRRQRRNAVSVIALGLRPPDFRQTAINAAG